MNSNSCMSSYEDARIWHRNNCNDSNCTQFCTNFPQLLPKIYLAISVFSGVCCLGVFATYFFLPRLRQTGYSSKVFLNRTLMDFIIAVGHIISGIFSLAEAQEQEHIHRFYACGVLGAVNEMALIASNLWYIFLAVDLIKAIRNPFSAKPSYGCFSHFLVLGFSFLCAVILGLVAIPHGPGGPGTSMFYWCWIQVQDSDGINDLKTFVLMTLFLYYLWHLLLWVVSMVVVVIAGCILWGHLAASSSTRKFVVNQNLKYVIVLGFETFFVLIIWFIQLSLLSKKKINYYYTTYDLGLAILFAIVHSIRGSVDLFVWCWTFSISLKDFSYFFRRFKIRFSTKKALQVPLPTSNHLNTPLLIENKKDNLVNKLLRRNAIYCINVGILETVSLHMNDRQQRDRVGSVRESFAATALMEIYNENERDELRFRYKSPDHREQVVKRIPFPAASGVHLKEFAFIDLEPAVFSMLRESYGISPRMYRRSFKIKDASDIDSSKMLEKFTEGKSGSFFYFTQDYRFIIKTVTPSEEKFLRKIAYSYYTHMKDNPDSLIVRFFGLHKVRLAPEQGYISVVVMENIFYSSDQLKIHKRFDLKGSWVGRRSLKGGQSSDKYKGTLKDLDLGKEKILIGPEDKEQLMDQLRKDVQFLTSCQIMDYSLLLGIHHNNAHSSDPLTNVESELDGFIDVDTTITSTAAAAARKKSSPKLLSNRKSRTFSRRSSRHGTFSSARHGTMTSDEGELHVPWFRQDGGGLRNNSSLHPYQLEESFVDSMIQSSMVCVDSPPATYYFGVVDILQQFTLKKSVEHVWKTRVLRQDKRGLSAVNQNYYGERFLKFMDSIIE